MFIYITLLIPIIFSIYLVLFHRHKIVWWELVLPMLATTVFIFIAKYTTEHISVSFPEYHGSHVKKVEYYEPWNEWIEETCTREVSCGDNCTTTETYDCSYVEYHPARYILTTTTDEVIYISEGFYNKLKRKFGNEFFTDLHRDYYTKDGDLYYTLWDGGMLNSEAVTTVHSYENRIKASHSTMFNYTDLSEDDIKRYNLFDYPKIRHFYHMDGVLGDTTKDGKLANWKVNYLNSKLGKNKQVRVFILVFNSEDSNVGRYQESYWKGGNMNEFVICVGIDSNRIVKWNHVFSWTPSNELKIETRDYLSNMDTLNLYKLSHYMYDQIDTKFVRKDFKEFNYLTVEPSTTQIVFIIILALLINIGISFYIVTNQHK